jgi:hypothetical protein
MLISRKTKITVSILIPLLAAAAAYGKLQFQADSNSSRIEKMEASVKQTAENVQYLRGQWDAKFNNK